VVLSDELGQQRSGGGLVPGALGVEPGFRDTKGRFGVAATAALNALAQAAPVWLRAQVTAEWFDRYSRLIDECRLPKEEARRRAPAATIGADGLHLLTQLAQPDASPSLDEREAVQVLRQVWEQQYTVVGHCRWREVKELAPAAQLITSPQDRYARDSVKRSVIRIGYKAHLTETCDEELPPPDYPCAHHLGYRG
jgi:hypothetical protein